MTENKYMDVGSILQDLSSGTLSDPKGAIYVAEVYKKILCILLGEIGKTVIISKEVSDEYENSIPELEVFHADSGEIFVRVK